jgi:D-3-phosphoglycerate dehydrogenase / 2-oxoglutarate reductase
LSEIRPERVGASEVSVSFLVVQIDRSPELEPYTDDRATLAAAGGQLRTAESVDAEDVVTAAADADVVWLGWGPDLTREILAALPRCRLAVRWGVGYEQIDTAAATELGIAVANAPTYGTADVAEHAIGLLFAAAKRIAWAHEQIRAGGWPAMEAGNVHRIAGRTLGIIGVGRIGSATARRALGLGIRVIGYDIARSDAELREIGVVPVDLDTLAATADYVSVHVPYSPGNHHLVDAAVIGRFRRGTILVNTSRGRVLDQAAVAAALHDGHLAGAALDVYENEPLPADDPIRSAPNVVLTPHVASFSDEAYADLHVEMCRTTIEFMTTGWAGTIVNAEVRSQLRAAPA